MLLLQRWCHAALPDGMMLFQCARQICIMTLHWRCWAVCIWHWCPLLAPHDHRVQLQCICSGFHSEAFFGHYVPSCMLLHGPSHIDRWCSPTLPHRQSYKGSCWWCCYPIKVPQLCLVSVWLHSASLSGIAHLASHVCRPVSHNWLHAPDCQVWDELAINLLLLLLLLVWLLLLSLLQSCSSLVTLAPTLCFLHLHFRIQAAAEKCLWCFPKEKWWVKFLV